MPMAVAQALAPMPRTRPTKSPLTVQVGRLMRRAREEAGLTRAQVADRLEVSDRTIQRWENGFLPPFLSIMDFIEAVGASANEVLRPALSTDPAHLARQLADALDRGDDDAE